MKKTEINQYLNKGFIWDGEYPNPPRIQDELSFSEAKSQFWNKMENCIQPYTSYKNVLWTMSSGLDTSSILSHARRHNNNLDTVCFDNGRGDAEFSSQLAKEWDMKNHKILKISPEKIEEYLLDINKILSSPVAHSYIFMSYWLFKYAEERGAEYLIMGDGPDVSMIGTHVLHRELIEVAVKLRQYDVQAANEVIKQSKYVEPSMIEHTRLLYNALTKYTSPEKAVYNTTYFYDTWAREAIPGRVPKWKLRQNTLQHRIWAEWVQFLVRTRKPTNEMLDHFNFKQISPFMVISDFCLTLPFHYRYCLHSTKHLMLDTYGPSLPLYITYKERTGFNPSDPWANENAVAIEHMLDEYVWNKNSKIHDYMDVEKMHRDALGFFTFNQKWSLINLSMWLQCH